MATEGDPRLAAVLALAGRRLGHSDWLEVTQERVDRFADATGDHQWLHVDPQRARASRFGGTIAPGFLVLALASPILAQLLRLPGYRTKVNYGCEWVRFLAPVPVGSRVRARATVDAVDEAPGGVRLTVTLVYTVEGQRVPACTARVLVLAYPDGWEGSGNPARADT